MSRPKKIVPKESEVQATILQWLLLKKIFCWRNNTTGIYDPYKKTFRFNPYVLKGIADILGILPDGKFLAIEVKRPGGKLSEWQTAFLQAIQQYGGIAFMAEDVKDVEERLKTYVQ